MKSLLRTVAACAVLAIAAAGCKTTEANYRAAYDKAVAGRNDNIALDSTVYGKVRREMRSSFLVAAGDSVPMRTLFVSPTPDEDDNKTTLGGRYGIAVGQFKTLFNARSLCDRLHEAGYPAASIVNTSEPYYYVIASWTDDAAEAATALRRIERKQPVAMREPLPFVLSPAGRR